jgi:hypothetical protein
MHAVLALVLVAAVALGGQNDLEAVAARLQTHAETAGLKQVSNPVVGADAVEHEVGGSLGRIQALFLDLATSERNLEVTSIELTPASDAERNRGAAIVLRYRTRYVAAPDDRVTRGQLAIPAIFNALLSGSVAGRDVRIHAARIADGTMTLDARSNNKDASKALVTQLDPGPQKLVQSADVQTEIKRERIVSDDPAYPVRDKTVYAFRLTARFDPSAVPLPVLRRLAHAY